jgi:hypothetical protein
VCDVIEPYRYDLPRGHGCQERYLIEAVRATGWPWIGKQVAREFPHGLAIEDAE